MVIKRYELSINTKTFKSDRQTYFAEIFNVYISHICFYHIVYILRVHQHICAGSILLVLNLDEN